MTNENKVLALIPAYNEAERIACVITGTSKYLPVLVVDDGSDDATAQVSRDNGAEVLRYEPNRGKGAALMAGFRYAMEQGYEAVLTLDADGQHDPDEIPLFLEEFTRGADLIIGKRDFQKMPFPRNISNTIGTWSFSNALGQYCPDNQSGYRLHSRRLVEDSLASRETNFEFEVEIIVRCVIAGYMLSWVPIKTIYGDQGSHIHHVRHVLNFYRLVRKTRQAIRAHKIEN